LTGTWDALSGSWAAVIVFGTMSLGVHASPPSARRGLGMLLTRRRPIDFGLVATCLCCR
jgi:hypothetical protein